MILIVCRHKVIIHVYYFHNASEVMMDICKKFGNKVRELRIAQGLSQEILAQKSGLHRTYIGGIERGERNISLINIEKIANVFDISMASLMGDL